MRFLKDRFPKYDIGEYSYGEDPLIFDWNEGSTLRIGKFCSLGASCVFVLGGNHHSDRISTYPFYNLFANLNKKDSYTNGNIIIGSDVWCGNYSCIMSGVTIGHGSILGAMSVVRKDVEPYSIVIGNPAIVIKKRFSDSDVEKLLQIQWWNWDINKIRKYWKLIIGKDIDALCKIA